ncbi:MAG: RIP metalloprotease RseP [Sphingomonadales bacterium]|nr:RIP metalloprotease RseP [Sphingomonadales bacterium]
MHAPLLHSPSLLVTVAAFLLMLAPLIVLHELGHYLVARWCGVRADAFSVGFGKELVGWTDRRGTRWKLSSIPLGGYVQFAGDMNAMSMPAEEAAKLPPEERQGIFQFHPLWQRTLIVLAGPVMNLLVALAIFTTFNIVYGRIVAAPVIAGFSAPSPAQAAGLRVGDRIVRVDGAPIVDFDEIREKVLPFPGEPLTLDVLRGGKPLTVTVTIASHVRKDEFGNESRIGQIGIAAGGFQVVRSTPLEAMRLSVDQSVGIVRLMITGVKQIVVGQRSVKELGGPVKIAQFSGQQLSLGIVPFVYFAAFISINLAFINLLPIPALDGGHLAFYAAEAVRRKPLDVRSQEWAFRTGLAFVLALMLFVTINDLMSLKLFG